jgi:hypothetical protein
MSAYLRRVTVLVVLAFALVMMPTGVSLGAAAGDTVQGTFTVDGKTLLFKYVYVTRAADPGEPATVYLIVLVSDTPVAAERRTAAGLGELARDGKIHAVRVMWKEGFDSLTATPFHKDIAESGQPTSGGAVIDLRAYDERRLSAQIKSRAIGQTWHFNARLEAMVTPATLTAADVAEPAPVVPPTDVERDTRVEAGRDDPTSLKRTLGRFGYEYTGVAFLQAVNEGHLDAVRLFLRLGMSPDTVSEGQPVLMSAAMQCTREPADSRVDIVRALLAAHAKVDPKDENGSTPLLWAVNVGCPADMVRALITAGANVNVKAKGGGTPLMLAQALQRAELVTILRAAGAKP